MGVGGNCFKSKSHTGVSLGDCVSLTGGNSKPDVDVGCMLVCRRGVAIPAVDPNLTL